MKGLIKAASFLPIYFLLPLSVLASDVVPSLDSDVSSEFDYSLVTRKRGNKHKVTQRRTLSIQGESFDSVPGSGAIFHQSLNAKLRIPVVELPSAPTFPLAAIGIRIPSDFNSNLKSTFRVQFVTNPNELELSGNVRIVINSEQASPGGTLAGGNPPSIFVGEAELQVQVAPATKAANYYLASITTQKFKPGQFVYITIGRDNNISNNFPNAINIVGLELDYNR